MGILSSCVCILWWYRLAFGSVSWYHNGLMLLKVKTVIRSWFKVFLRAIPAQQCIWFTWSLQSGQVTLIFIWMHETLKKCVICWYWPTKLLNLVLVWHRICTVCSALLMHDFIDVVFHLFFIILFVFHYDMKITFLYNYDVTYDENISINVIFHLLQNKLFRVKIHFSLCDFDHGPFKSL